MKMMIPFLGSDMTYLAGLARQRPITRITRWAVRVRTAVARPYRMLRSRHASNPFSKRTPWTTMRASSSVSALRHRCRSCDLVAMLGIDAALFKIHAVSMIPRPGRGGRGTWTLGVQPMNDWAACTFDDSLAGCFTGGVIGRQN